MLVTIEGTRRPLNKGLQLTTNSLVESIRGTVLAAGACASALAVSAVRGY